MAESPIKAKAKARKRTFVIGVVIMFLNWYVLIPPKHIIYRSS
jgi:hypothetical protein